MNKWLTGCWIIISLFACGNEVTETTSDSKKIQEIKTEDDLNADIIRNPISADGTTDTVNVAKIEFDYTIHDFGTVKEGTKVKHTFHFENTGKIPLLIANARSTCGCTVPKWPKETIEPGGKGKIDVVFNTDGKKEYQDKPVTITANTFPNKTVVHMKGFVEKK